LSDRPSTSSDFADPLVRRLAAFIRKIGLPLEAAVLDGSELLAGITVKDGRILLDEARLAHPGDLLHEAGHLAVCDPALRSSLPAVGEDGGEEMAAMAWSYAAAVHLGVDPRLVFHDDGYRGGAALYLETYERGGSIGQPLLQWFGMTLTPESAAVDAGKPFPHMRRWLR
jgi:hypothetical protein